jgi:hypothetical protein
MSLEPHQAIALVLCCEAIVSGIFVFSHSTFDVAGYSDVKNMGAARCDVRVVAAVAHGSSLASVPMIVWMSKVMGF